MLSALFNPMFQWSSLPASCKIVALGLLGMLFFPISIASGQSDQVSYFRSDRGIAADDQPLPNDFSQDAKLEWRIELPPGHSSPCISGDSVFLTTFEAEHKRLATVAVDRTTGQLRWQKVVSTERIESVHATGSPAASTPAANGRLVFAFFGSHGLICYDWQGNQLWDVPLGPFQDEFGAASSPVLVDDKIILNEDHDLHSFIIAIDQQTGAIVWKTAREEATRSYSSPFILEREGKKEILIAGSLQLAAYDPDTGQKRWWYNGLSRIVDTTPAVHDGIIYLASWTPGGDAESRIRMEPFAEALKSYDKNNDQLISKDELPAGGAVLERFFRIDLDQNDGLDADEWARHASVFERAQNVAVALEPGTDGNLEPRYVRWTQTRGLPVVPSAVVYHNTVTMVKDSGIITILDRETGKQIQQLRAAGQGNYYASLIAGDGKVYAISEQGMISVLLAGDPCKLLSSHDLGERVMATPVICNGRIYIRSDAALYCFSKS